MKWHIHVCFLGCSWLYKILRTITFHKFAKLEFFEVTNFFPLFNDYVIGEVVEDDYFPFFSTYVNSRWGILSLNFSYNLLLWFTYDIWRFCALTVVCLMCSQFSWILWISCFDFSKQIFWKASRQGLQILLASVDATIFCSSDIFLHI